MAPRVVRDAREAFVERVKAIDPIFRRGDLKAFWPLLRELMDIGPGRPDLSKKKSHYLASLAARSLARGDPEAARAFLDYADRSIDPAHMTAYLIDERKRFRRHTEAALASKAALRDAR